MIRRPVSRSCATLLAATLLIPSLAMATPPTPAPKPLPFGQVKRVFHEWLRSDPAAQKVFAAAKKEHKVRSSAVKAVACGVGAAGCTLLGAAPFATGVPELLMLTTYPSLFGLVGGSVGIAKYASAHREGTLRAMEKTLQSSSSVPDRVRTAFVDFDKAREAWKEEYFKQRGEVYRSPYRPAEPPPAARPPSPRLRDYAGALPSASPGRTASPTPEYYSPPPDLSPPPSEGFGGIIARGFMAGVAGGLAGQAIRRLW